MLRDVLGLVFAGGFMRNPAALRLVLFFAALALLLTLW